MVLMGPALVPPSNCATRLKSRISGLAGRVKHTDATPRPVPPLPLKISFAPVQPGRNHHQLTRTDAPQIPQIRYSHSTRSVALQEQVKELPRSR